MKSNITLIVLLFLLTQTACKEAIQNSSRVDTLPFYNEATVTPHWLDSNE